MKKIAILFIVAIVSLSFCFAEDRMGGSFGYPGVAGFEYDKQLNDSCDAFGVVSFSRKTAYGYAGFSVVGGLDYFLDSFLVENGEPLAEFSVGGVTGVSVFPGHGTEFLLCATVKFSTDLKIKNSDINTFLRCGGGLCAGMDNVGPCIYLQFGATVPTGGTK